MGSSASCPKGTTGKGWWTTKCYANGGYKMTQGNGKKPAQYCGISHSGNNCWGVTFSNGDPAWCIDGNIVLPARGYTNAAFFEGTCGGGCQRSPGICDDYAGKTVEETLPTIGTKVNAGPSVVGGAAALFFVGGAFLGRRKMKSKKASTAEAEVEVTGGDSV
ncbi:hypothetical protein TrST_g10378 [Triparma strigata]|uniref:Uncharacterized protein n=1 Tax=Triparma strigata TaxID=1606541 RepID=A0A9W7C804_9STRA|nr:hypothetical protein TrST_g10378 [Triparma strigata]